MILVFLAQHICALYKYIDRYIGTRTWRLDICNGGRYEPWQGSVASVHWIVQHRRGNWVSYSHGPYGNGRHASRAPARPDACSRKTPAFRDGKLQCVKVDLPWHLLTGKTTTTHGTAV